MADKAFLPIDINLHPLVSCSRLPDSSVCPRNRNFTLELPITTYCFSYLLNTVGPIFAPSLLYALNIEIFNALVLLPRPLSRDCPIQFSRDIPPMFRM
jgi:hypothetical protein